jgi:hypothetical protein
MTAVLHTRPPGLPLALACGALGPTGVRSISGGNMRPISLKRRGRNGGHAAAACSQGAYARGAPEGPCGTVQPRVPRPTAGGGACRAARKRTVPWIAQHLSPDPPSRRSARGTLAPATGSAPCDPAASSDRAQPGLYVGYFQTRHRAPRHLPVAVCRSRPLQSLCRGVDGLAQGERSPSN